MARTEFTNAVRDAAYKRCAGHCEKCTATLYPGKFAYDHKRPDGLGGEATLENCQVLCSACHGVKTHSEDRPIMTKADNIRKKHIGARVKRGFRPAPDGFKFSWRTGRMEKTDV